MDFKPVASKTVESEIVPFGTLNPNFNGYNSVTGSSLTFTVAQRNPNNGRAFSNLYASFNLPAANFVVNSWDVEWSSNALEKIENNDNVVVIEIPKDEYGELIDGRTIKLTLPFITGGTFDCYSSYYLGYNASSDPSQEAEYFGHKSALNMGVANPDVETPSTNVSFLFSDKIRRPVNGGSWSDGFTTSSPPAGYPDATTYFSFAQDKVVARSTSGATIGLDEPIGICYLDKGFIVITDSAATQSINWSASTEGTGFTYSALTQVSFTADSSVTFYSFEKQWVLNVLCEAGSGEFGTTKNPTAADLNPTVNAYGEYELYSVNKPVYISEIGLYDTNGNMLAIAKPDRPIEKYYNNPTYFNLKFRF
jgi:hypothetical protein